MNIRATAWITLILCTYVLYLSVNRLIEYRTYENLVVSKIPLKEGNYSLLLDNECIGKVNIRLFENTNKGININGILNNSGPSFKFGIIFNPFGQMVGGTATFEDGEDYTEYRLNHISPISVVNIKPERTEIRRFLGPLSMKIGRNNRFSIYYNIILRGKEKLTRIPFPNELRNLSFQAEGKEGLCEIENHGKARTLVKIVEELA